jgi:enoyl-CoA hydratase/carnithine racemase
MSFVEIEARGAVDVIRLNRPEVLNALNGGLILDLHNALMGSTARVVVISGRGSSFCAGGDRREGIGIEGELMPSIDRLQAITTMLQAPKRVSICAVEGWAVGGGMELAVACDLIVAATTARFRLPDVAIGAGLTGGSTWLLPRIVGSKRFFGLVLGEEELDAQAGLEWGIVNRVVEAGTAEVAALELAARLASISSEATATFKRVASHSLENTLEEALRDEAESVAPLIETSETFHFK